LWARGPFWGRGLLRPDVEGGERKGLRLIREPVGGPAGAGVDRGGGEGPKGLGALAEKGK